MYLCCTSVRVRQGQAYSSHVLGFQALSEFTLFSQAHQVFEKMLSPSKLVSYFTSLRIPSPIGSAQLSGLRTLDLFTEPWT
jgi:hypothetical protein